MLEYAGKHCDDNNPTALAAVLNDNYELFLLEFPSRYFTLSLLCTFHLARFQLQQTLSHALSHGQTKNSSVSFGISPYTLPTVLVDKRHIAPSHA